MTAEALALVQSVNHDAPDQDHNDSRHRDGDDDAKDAEQLRHDQHRHHAQHRRDLDALGRDQRQHEVALDDVDDDAQQGVDVDGGLAKQLLELNAHLRFGAFAWDPEERTVLFTHTILGGHTLDPEELTATLRDVALVADEYDDKLMKKYGGQRMIDLLEEAAMERIMDKDPNSFRFDD